MEAVFCFVFIKFYKIILVYRVYILYIIHINKKQEVKK